MSVAEHGKCKKQKVTQGSTMKGESATFARNSVKIPSEESQAECQFQEERDPPQTLGQTRKNA